MGDRRYESACFRTILILCCFCSLANSEVICPLFFGFILLLSYSKLITAISAAGGSLFEVACRYSDASMRNVVLERKVCSVVVSLFRTCVQEWDPPVKTPALELESSVQ
jgi:hypothetical protein